MKKKIISYLLVLAVFVPCLFLLTACGKHSGHSINKDTWQTNETGHWHGCAGCKETADYAVHSGGTKNCMQKATCEVCGTLYGEIGEHNFSTTAQTVAPTCTEAGYTGYPCLNTGCTEVNNKTNPTDALGHNFNHEGICENGCAETAQTYSQSYALNSGSSSQDTHPHIATEYFVVYGDKVRYFAAEEQTSETSSNIEMYWTGLSGFGDEYNHPGEYQQSYFNFVPYSYQYENPVHRSLYYYVDNGVVKGHYFNYDNPLTFEPLKYSYLLAKTDAVIDELTTLTTEEKAQYKLYRNQARDEGVEVAVNEYTWMNIKLQSNDNAEYNTTSTLSFAQQFIDMPATQISLDEFSTATYNAEYNYYALDVCVDSQHESGLIENADITFDAETGIITCITPSEDPNGEDEYFYARLYADLSFEPIDNSDYDGGTIPEATKEIFAGSPWNKEFLFRMEFPNSSDGQLVTELAFATYIFKENSADANMYQQMFLNVAVFLNDDQTEGFVTGNDISTLEFGTYEKTLDEHDTAEFGIQVEGVNEPIKYEFVSYKLEFISALNVKVTVNYVDNEVPAQRVFEGNIYMFFEYAYNAETEVMSLNFYAKNAEGKLMMVKLEKAADTTAQSITIYMSDYPMELEI